MAVAMRAQNGSPGKGCGKAAPWKSLKADFSTALGNPAKGAGFPLSHSPDGGGPSTMKRTYRVLRKPDILTCYHQESLFPYFPHLHIKLHATHSPASRH